MFVNRTVPKTSGSGDAGGRPRERPFGQWPRRQPVLFRIGTRPKRSPQLGNQVFPCSAAAKVRLRVRKVFGRYSRTRENRDRARRDAICVVGRMVSHTAIASQATISFSNTYDGESGAQGGVTR